MADDFLTVAEIAEMLRVNPQTVRNWLDRGELPGVRVGARRVRVRRRDLDAFLATETAPSTTAAPANVELTISEPTATIDAAALRSDVIPALREFAAAAERLANSLERVASSSSG